MGHWREKVNSKYRKSRPKVFCRKGVLRNFVKFSGKYYFNCDSLHARPNSHGEAVNSRLKGSRLMPATLLKKRLRHRCSAVDFAEILRTPLLIESPRWLLLHKE